MAIDLAALRAKLAAQKAATTASTTGATNGIANGNTVPNSTGAIQASVPSSSVNNVPTVGSGGGNTKTILAASTPAPTVNPPAKLGTSKTTEIDHMDFLSKMNSLSEAIHKQHPTMPVLLRQIHKQLRDDPELVSTLDEDAIGIVVKGLQIQTKTELVTAATKTTKAKKNPAIDLSMF